MKRIAICALAALVACSAPQFTRSGLNPKDFEATYNGAATGL